MMRMMCSSAYDWYSQITRVIVPASSAVCAEQRRLRILAIEVVQDRQRLEADVVAVLQHRHAAARIHLQQRRRLVLLLRELHQVRDVRTAACIRARAAPATNTGCRCPTRVPMPWSRLESCAPCAIVTVRRSEQTISMATPPLKRFGTLISAAELAPHLADSRLADRRLPLRSRQTGQRRARLRRRAHSACTLCASRPGPGRARSRRRAAAIRCRSRSDSRPR